MKIKERFKIKKEGLTDLLMLLILAVAVMLLAIVI
jgi:hypothetical protein